MNTIFTRRSIRKFATDKIEPEKLTRILKAGMQAPSAHNSQPWEFLVLEAQENKAAIAEISPYAPMTTNCGAVIIVMGNMDKARKDPDFWIQDLSAATQNILLQIAEEDLGGVWLGFYPDEKYKTLHTHFNLPENIIPFAAIALGHTEHENRFVDRYDETKVHYETY